MCVYKFVQIPCVYSLTSDASHYFKKKLERKKPSIVIFTHSNLVEWYSFILFFHSSACWNKIKNIISLGKRKILTRASSSSSSFGMPILDQISTTNPFPRSSIRYCCPHITNINLWVANYGVWKASFIEKTLPEPKFKS